MQTSLQEKAVCSHRAVIFITTYCDYLQRWCHKIWYILVNFPFIPLIPFIPLTQPWLLAFSKNSPFWGSPLVKNPFKLQPPTAPWVRPPARLLVLLVHAVWAWPLFHVVARSDGLSTRRGGTRRGRTRGGGTRGAWDPLDTPRDQTQRLRDHWAPENERTGEINGEDDCLRGFFPVLLCFFGGGF